MHVKSSIRIQAMGMYINSNHRWEAIYYCRAQKILVQSRIQAMGRGELTSGGGRTSSRLGGGVAKAGDLVVTGDGHGEGVTIGGGGAIGSIRTPLDGSGYGVKRESSTRLL
jgi:hypothetical protein